MKDLQFLGENDMQYFREMQLNALGNEMLCQNHRAAVTVTKKYWKKQLSNVTVPILVRA